MKHLAKLASLMLALVMVLCCALPVFAVNTDDTPNNTPHTITITNAQEGHTYEAYQVFRGDISDGKLTNITWGSGVNGSALLAALKADAKIGSDFTDCKTAEDVAYVVAGYGDDSEKLDAFAEVVGANLSDTKVSKTTAVGATQVKIIVSGDGYYLLKDQDGSLAGDKDQAYTKYILNVVANVDVEAKVDVPDMDKKIVEGEERLDATNVSIGDSIRFELTSDVPNMDGYDTYTFIFHDTLSEGLTFNNDIEVTIGADDLKKGTDYTVSVDGQKITVTFLNFIEWKDTPEDADTICVTYTATLNEKADITTAGNVNKAHLEYTVNPNFSGDGDNDGTPDGDTPPTGTTTVKEVKVYTTGIKLTKVNNDGKTLTGAKFSISGESVKAVLINEEVFVVASEGQNGTAESSEGTAAENVIYYRLKNGTYTTTAPTKEGVDATVYDRIETTVKGENVYTYTTYHKVMQVVESTIEEPIVTEGWVGSDGVITFTGLGEGSYTITELIAPAGYNLLKEPVTIGIKWNGADADNMWTVRKGVNADNITAEDVTDVDITIDNNIIKLNVINKEGATLPATGGIGTTIFYVLGSVLAVGAVILLVTKKRMSAEA